ncbi:MAG TPA: TerC family protein [Tepidisphaeraceae bacterium]|jgi:tellurite resistance protein TerC
MLWIWLGFITFVLLMLALDLGVFHRKAHVVKVKEALIWSAIWASMGLSFSFFVYHAYENHWMGIGNTVDAVDGAINDGRSATIKYLTGYVVEKSLSVDNVFVIAMIFGAFAVPAMYQHRVLFWGILGALIMRGVMIGLGAKLIAEYHWVLYVFGVFLILTAVKMLLVKEHSDPSQNFIVKLTRKFFPITERYHGQHFWVRAGSNASHAAPVPGAAVEVDAAVDRMEKLKPGALMMTPLFLVLLLVEFTDLIFAVDSIPAIFAITADPFLVFTSNVFAILGLRSLYFALAGAIDKFKYLKVSLAAVLALVGVKMLAASWLKETVGPNFNLYLLVVVLLILVAGVVASMIANNREASKTALPPAAH